jgi:hypothetical protein
VPLEQFGERAAITGAEPLAQMDGLTGRVVLNLAHTL